MFPEPSAQGLRMAIQDLGAHQPYPLVGEGFRSGIVYFDDGIRLVFDDIDSLVDAGEGQGRICRDRWAVSSRFRKSETSGKSRRLDCEPLKAVGASRR